MTDLIEKTLHRLSGQLGGRFSLPGDDRYAAATAIWAKPVGRMPRAVAHCLISPNNRRVASLAPQRLACPNLNIAGGARLPRVLPCTVF
jgi:hypothetical protein